jgi:ABC transporter substrate binding protein
MAITIQDVTQDIARHITGTMVRVITGTMVPVITVTNPAWRHHWWQYRYWSWRRADGLFAALRRAGGPDRTELKRARILKGAKPSELPVQEPTTFDFVINRKTAKAQGIKMPGSLSPPLTMLIE